MLYRWRMEKKNGTLHENKTMNKKAQPSKTNDKQAAALQTKDAELLKANKRIKELEKSLASKQEELDILKKAKRFFEKTKR
jgi:transposase